MFRLRELRKNKGLTMKGLGDMLGLAESTISQYETEKREPDFETLQRLADFFNVSTDYLLGRTNGSSSRKKGIKIPVLGRVQAGIPVEAIEDIIGEEEIAEELAKTGEFFGLVIRGDSMSPSLVDGDIVIIRKQPDIESGEIAVILVNGNDATCKKVVKHKDGISLVPLNGAFQPMFYTSQEIEELPVEVIGKVVEMHRSF